MSPEDEAALAAFLAPGADSYHQRTLADMVLDKIREKQGELGVAEIPRCGCARAGWGRVGDGTGRCRPLGVWKGARHCIGRQAYHLCPAAVHVYGRGSPASRGSCLAAEWRTATATPGPPAVWRGSSPAACAGMRPEHSPLLHIT